MRRHGRRVVQRARPGADRGRRGGAGAQNACLAPA